MRYANSLKLSMMASAVMVAAALMAPGNSQARNWEVREFSDGGFEIEFSNGCTVTYDRYGERAGNSRNCKNKQLNSADETARSHHGSNTSSHSNAVPQGQMRKYCQGEASAKLNERPNYLSTDDVERMGDEYVVRGRLSDSDSNTTFECTFDRHGVFQGVDVRSAPGYSNAVPQGQMRKYCQGEASAKLNERPNYLSTDDVERVGGEYVVRGRLSDSNSNTTFECTFDKHGVFQGVDVTRHDNNYGSNDTGEIPWAAKSKCLDTFGNSPDITSISPLRPGYWEVIMQDRHGPRSVACTVTSSGQIQDWIELD